MSPKNIKFNISRLMGVLLCAIIFFCVPIKVDAAEGVCGDDLSWIFDGTTLTISGTGVMDNYTDVNPAPWYEYRNQILGLSLPEELTVIGSRAFAECINLSVVNIPENVQIIKEYAFLECTSLTMLILNEGMRTIGECAFEQCISLSDLRLPNTLLNIGNHAFYMCDSLTYITIPGYVQTIGSGVFCYCSNLIRADINASVEMPLWSFYGCDKLQIVTIQGKTVEPESLMVVTPPLGIDSSDVTNENSGGHDGNEVENTPVTEAPDIGYVSGESVILDGNGNYIVETNVVKQSSDATVVTTNKTPLEQPNNSVITIIATIYNDSGWNDVLDKVNSATIGGNTSTLDVTVYIPESDAVSADALKQFAGKNILLTIQTQSGSQYTLDCTKLEDKIKNDLNLNYTLVPAEEVPEELVGYTVYKLNFLAAAKLPTELIIRLPGGHVLSTATLYQLKGESKLEKLQSVVVDPYGDTHWYVSAVDEKTEYLIGIDVPTLEEEPPIIPPTLHDVYKVENVYDGVEYVITGRSSSWGMNLGQVMGIMAAVMISVIVIVGVVLYMWNKSRLKKGYVPGWDGIDDEDED